ncbi:hypothetical protein LOK49_LG02G02937 [Camellia lanceoleosa]|uniref:Uncharacterized protein n=1 Tax=Camellia lanceoleosa TaxID=1840588 RepID=A0ACC0IL60_9ERIC|nr:hypothetical protein LOK49_LG02G02937 [Camellia lanceoleosa]
MDLKFKGKRWVGNIFQKFEAMCQEVDDFVSQDTVKYVENQVHTVGDSVKKFCSDVVHDLIPSSLVEPGNHEAQAVSPKQNDSIDTYVRSMIGIEEKAVYTDINQFSMEQDLIGPLKTSHEQFIHPPSVDCIKEAKSDLSLGPEVDNLKDNKSDIVLDGSETKEELIGIEENPLCTDINQFSVEKDLVDPLKNNPEQFIHLPSAESIKEAESDISLGPEVDALKDKKLYIDFEENDSKEDLIDKKFDIVEENDTRDEGNDTKEELIDKKSDIVEENDTNEELIDIKSDLVVPENNNLSESSSLSESTDERILAEVLTVTLVFHTQKEEMACNSLLDDIDFVSDISSIVPPSEMDYSVVSGDDKTADLGLIYASSSLTTETYRMSEFSHANVTQNEENICYKPVDASWSSQLFPVLSRDDKVADARLAFSSSALSLESNDVDSLTTDDAASLVGSSGNKHQYCYECTQLEALMPSLKIGTVHLVLALRLL